MNPSLEESRILLGKARDDQHAAESLARSPSAAQWIIGFHAQQAMEKALKAVLAFKGIAYPRTHNLSMLLALLTQNGIQAPNSPADYALLTPFGAAFRYDDTSNPSEVTFDVSAILPGVAGMLTWAEKEVGISP